MKCESCHIKEATVQVKQVADGVVKEVCLCSDCAESSGLKSPEAIADFLFGAEVPVPKPKKTVNDNKRCPKCRLTRNDFNKNTRLGCETCYTTFAEELTPIIEDLHRATKHIGKTPARESTCAEIKVLKEKLLDAVHRQAFEEAAEFRDQIKALELV